MHATYFEGNHKHDPGWYIKGKGPYLTKADAEADSEIKWVAMDLCLNPVLKESTPEKIEEKIRPKLLGIALLILIPAMAWFGIYKFVTWGIR